MRTAVGSSDSERLRLESELWQGDARELFELAAPASDAACLDAGCGPAGALLALSQAVPDGRVVGLDIDHDLLEDARALIEREQLGNVELFCDDVTRFHPARLFDLAHLRFAPVTVGPGAGRLLRSLVEMTKPGGAVVRQEPAGRFTYGSAPSRSLDRLMEISTCAYRRIGVDMQAGDGLADALRSEGVEVVAERRARRRLRPGDPYLRLPLMLAAALRDPILENDLVTAAELELLVEMAEQEAQQPRLRCNTFELVGVVARLPA